MTGREWGALIILAGLALLAVAFAAGIRALILAVTHQGRHEQREAEAEAEADTFIEELRGLPRAGLDYISDVTVRLPWTPPLPRVEPGPPVVADITDAARRAILAPAERLASDTDVRTIQPPAADVADVLPAWVIEALNGHNTVDALVESIVARTVSGA